MELEEIVEKRKDELFRQFKQNVKRKLRAWKMDDNKCAFFHIIDEAVKYLAENRDEIERQAVLRILDHPRERAEKLERLAEENQNNYAVLEELYARAHHLWIDAARIEEEIRRDPERKAEAVERQNQCYKKMQECQKDQQIERYWALRDRRDLRFNELDDIYLDE